MKTLLGILFLWLPLLLSAQNSKFGALAIDRSNGFYYGWAIDYDTQSGANTRALDECKRKGGKCEIVKQWGGGYCAAYRTINGDVGTAYGWGIARTREEADRIATQECLKRSDGIPCQNYVWGCNSKEKKKEEEKKEEKEEQKEVAKEDDFWAGKEANSDEDVSQDFWNGKGTDSEEKLFENQTKPPESNQFIGDIESFETKYLTVKCIDHGAVDGDQVSVRLNGSLIKSSITLSNYYTSFEIQLKSGQNRIDFEALNEGSMSPNTAKFIITDDQGNVISDKEWNIYQGFTATLLIVTY